MARVEIRENVTQVRDDYLRPVASASVYVRRVSNGVLASVFAAPSGGSPLAQPLISDAVGRIEGWVEEGYAYDLEISKTGVIQPYVQRSSFGGPDAIALTAHNTDATAHPAIRSRIAVIEEFLNVNDPRFGALGNDSADDAAAFSAAVALLPANGGKIVAPPGGYRLSAFPSLNGKRSVTISGAGGRSGGAGEATRFIKTGGGTGSFISAQSSFGVVIEDVAIIHDTGFTGVLVDFSNPSGFDTAYGPLRNVTLAKTGAATRGALGLNLAKAISCNFDGVVFRDLTVGVRGRAVVSDYSNIMNFRGCTWLGHVTAPVRNIGSNWGFDGGTVQQLVDNNAAFIKRDPGFWSNGGYVHGLWMGDTVSTSGGNWIEWAGNGFSIQGNTFGYCAKGIVAEDLTTPIGSRGLSVQANQLPPSNTAVHLVGALGSHRQHTVMANNWPGSVLAMDNQPYYSLIMGPTGLAASLDFMETAAPPAPVANGSRLYTDDSGAGKTRLRWRADSADNNVITSA